jgi:hypothetical protein
MLVTELLLIRAWVNARIAKIRDNGEDAGFTTLEWVAIAAVVVAGAIVIAIILMNKGKKAANNNVNLQ